MILLFFGGGLSYVRVMSREKREFGRRGEIHRGGKGRSDMGDDGDGYGAWAWAMK